MVEEGRIKLGKRPWHPPIKGHPAGPEATLSEIHGETAPVVIDGELSRKLRPQERIDQRRKFNPPTIIFSSITLQDQTREELDGSGKNPEFTNREIEVLQCLVDDISLKERVERLGISNGDRKIYEKLIAEKLGHKSRQEGLREAIVRGVQFGFLDTSKLPDSPTTPFSPRESHALVALVKGYSTTQACEEFDISPMSLSTYRSNAFEKLGRLSQYQAIAWAARDMMMRGEL